MLLRGKSVVVTGAGMGIGRGIALVLAQEGARVIVSDIESASGACEETASMARREGGDVVAFVCDVTQAGSAEALVAAAVERFGRLDCAVNNAGIAIPGALAEMSDEAYERVMAVNLRGTFRGLRAQLMQMASQAGGGAIVNVASVAGLCAVADIGIYTASKHGVIGLTKSAAKEYGGQGIRVNAVCPNAIRTPLLVGSPPDFQRRLVAPQAIQRFGEPEEVGAAVAWLCSDKASFVTGVALPVDGGYMTGP
jgi:NAD(P)-dependent dehydrogenase (short-subunit alcohol dehydrogenase family)